MRRYIDILREAADTPRVIRSVPRAEAEDMLHSAFFSGKNKGLQPRRFHKEKEDSVLVDLPLSMIQPNEEGDLYDGTVDRERALSYTKQQIDTPISARHGPRNVADRRFAYVSDGGHRVSAARMRGDTHIRALMPQSDYERLIAKYT